MSDRAVRFAARMIAVGLLGVAWTIGTLTMVLVQQSADHDWRLRLLGSMGMIPVGIMLIYVVLTDMADWRFNRGAGPADPNDPPDRK